jgi:hypothetical protein
VEDIINGPGTIESLKDAKGIYGHLVLEPPKAIILVPLKKKKKKKNSSKREPTSRMIYNEGCRLWAQVKPYPLEPNTRLHFQLRLLQPKS